MKKLTTFITALLLIVGMTQCKKTEKQATAEQEGDGTHICLNVSISNDAKTAITAAGIVSWSAGDKLCVVGETQGNLGTLTTEAGGSSSAKFKGTIKPITAQQTIHFYYLGNTTTEGTSYTYNITAQDGTLEGLTGLHLMHGMAANATPGQTVFKNVTMDNMMAIALFDISGYGSEAKCTGAISKRTLDLTTGDWDGNGTTTDAITLSNPSANYYMALIPSTAEQTLTFTDNSGLDPHSPRSSEITEGKFYSNGSKPIEIFTDFLDFGGEVVWARKNLGASRATDAGNYYSWGETITKANYNKENYKWYDVTNSKYFYTDGLTIMKDEDDAAYNATNGDWHIPTQDDFTKMKNKAYRVRITNGKYQGISTTGIVFYKAKNDKDCGESKTSSGGTGDVEITDESGTRTYKVNEDPHIFIPELKHYVGSNLTNGSYYWLNELDSEDTDNSDAYYFQIGSTVSITDNLRFWGCPIRPVKRKASQSGQESGR